MKNKLTLYNIVSSVILQLITMISGFIIPRIILTRFGSNANGLVSSISQFLNYIVLLEGGVTAVIYANLYKPLVQNDLKKISSIVVAAKGFYRKIGFIFTFYALILAIVYPKIVMTGYSDMYVFALTFVLYIGLFMQYMFSITYTVLLTADKKVYVISILDSILTLLNIFVVLLTIRFFPDILVLKLMSAVLFIFKPIVLRIYIDRHYSINWDENCDNNFVKHRWDGFAINLAYYIHTSTDIVVLSIFTNLKVVSIYAVYSLIVTKVSRLVHSVASSIEPTIGHSYAKGDFDDLNTKLDMYEFIIFTITGFLFTLTLLLIVPFVEIYTRGVSDADYHQPMFSLLLIASEVIYLVKYPHSSLAFSANKITDITKPAYVEAFINIIISILLVKKLGLVGVAIGTLCAMLYRTLFHIFYTRTLIPNRHPLSFIKKAFIFFITSAIVAVGLKFLLPLVSMDFLHWGIRAVQYGIIILLGYGAIIGIYFRKEFFCLIKYLKR